MLPSDVPPVGGVLLATAGDAPLGLTSTELLTLARQMMDRSSPQVHERVIEKLEDTLHSFSECTLNLEEIVNLENWVAPGGSMKQAWLPPIVLRSRVNQSGNISCTWTFMNNWMPTEMIRLAGDVESSWKLKYLGLQNGTRPHDELLWIKGGGRLLRGGGSGITQRAISIVLLLAVKARYDELVCRLQSSFRLISWTRLELIVEEEGHLVGTFTGEEHT